MSHELAAEVTRAVGANIRTYREAHAWSQSELGERMAKHLQKTWPRQSVWMAERGERALTATELIALGRTLNVSISDLFSGVEEDQDREVELKVYAAYRRGILDARSAVSKALQSISPEGSPLAVGLSEAADGERVSSEWLTKDGVE